MLSGDTGEEQNSKSIDHVCLIQILIHLPTPPTPGPMLCPLWCPHGHCLSTLFPERWLQIFDQSNFITYLLVFKMSLAEQCYLQSLLNQCEVNFGREEKEAKAAVIHKLTEIQSILKKNIKQTFSNFSLQVIVRFMEFTVEVQQKFTSADEFVNLFFQRVTAPSQFYIRALLVKAKLIAYKGHSKQLKGETMILALKESVSEINRALDLISGPNQPAQKGKDSKGAGDSSKGKYGFLIYNASACLYKIIRFMLRQSWHKNFTDIIQRIYKLFEEVDEPDQNWRCRFMLILFQCLYDSEKKPEAWKILDLLWQRAKAKNVDFLDSLFRLRVHYSKENNALTNVIKKDIEGADPNGWKILQILQRMKSGTIPEAQVQKELMGVVNQISLGVLSTNQQSASVTLSHIMQERLGQAGRIALKFNVINIANSIINFLAKARQPNQKAMVLNEYNKAELLIKKKNDFIDKKTGMMMNSTEIKELQIQRRKEALKILEKVMIANKKLDNPDLIYEGAVLIWNISLPFLCPQYREFVLKAFDYTCQLLEQIDSTDHDLRVKMHLELAKIHFANDNFQEVEKNVPKAIKLDHSIPAAKVQHKFQPEEDASLYYRPFQRYLHNFREKIIIKKGANEMNRSELDSVVNDLWNVADQKSETARINTLQNCLKSLMNIKQEKYKPDQSKMLVDEEIKQEKILFEQEALRNYKKKKLLAFDIAELSFEWELNEYAKRACRFVLQDKWEGKNSIELIIAQARCCYFLAQIEIDELIQDNFEVPYAQPVHFQNEEGKENQLSEEIKKQVESRKKSVFQTFSRGLELAESIQQHSLVFNGAIYLWNNFLHVFRNPINDSKLHKDISGLLRKFFQAMRTSLKEIESKGIVYYDLDIKIQAFANIGLVYARLMQSQKQPEEVTKICDALLLTPLSPHTRKLTNSMKARVTGSGGKAAGGTKDQKKGGKEVTQEKAGGYSDSFLFEIFSQLEIIQNSTNKTETEALIKKCYENLESWQPKDKDESELELHAELWARLARLAVNEGTTMMYKYALRCSQYSFSLVQNDKNISGIPPNRLRWYSLSQFLYSQCLFKIANPGTQDSESYEKLLFGALEHAVQATHKGFKSNVYALVSDGAKQVWNVCSKLQDSKKNRIKLMEPIRTVLRYLKEIKQETEVDLVLLLAQLFFKCANENNENKIGEQMADMLFNVVPKNMQKSLWEAKMIFMSKQGKNELQAISNMKQANSSLQSKLWVKLARISNNPKKQHAAYNKAIDILKKQNSIEIVEVLVEYSEWQLRVGNERLKNVVSNLLLASDYLIDIEYGEDDEEEDIQQDKGTVFSRSTRGKKSHASKSIKSEMKSSKVTKKAATQKGPSSIKSKGSSGMSRMSRSGRVAKATKSKNTKSIFSEREEDPEPDALTCIHYERLFRIHTILAMISDSIANKIRYALDAKQFLIKILELSFATANKIQQFSDKAKNSEVSFRIPTTVKQWVKFELSKQILEKVKTVEDPNFMGSFTFEKPELTYAYLKNLTEIFDKYGLSIHSIPLLFFKKFIANEIIQNKIYSDVVDLEQKMILRKIGYQDSQDPMATQILAQKYRISETDMKMEMIKTQSKVVTEESDANIFQSVQAPNLIEPLSNYQAWFEIGKLLRQFGEINRAKKYLKQAYKHFMILSNSQKAGECCIELLIVAFIEGENEEAMEHALNANKLCKQVKNWNRLLYWSCRLLLFLKKYQDIANFASKIYSTIEELISSLNKENSQKLIFESQMPELKDILTLVEIVDLDIRFTESFEEEILNPVKGILTAIKQIEERVVSGDILSIQNYQYFLGVSQKIIEFFIFGKEKGSHITITVFDRIFSLILKVEKKLFDLMKYALVGSGPEFKKNEVIGVYQEYRYLIASAYCYQSTQQIMGENLVKQDEEQSDQVSQLIDPKNEHFKKYMEKLNLEIQRKMMPVPVNLNPIDSSISILQNIKTHVLKDTYQEVLWSASYIRALTLKARASRSLQNIWAPASENLQLDSEEAALSLESITDFLDKNWEEKLLDFSQNGKCFEVGQKLYESLLENAGHTLRQRAFQYLCKLQHCSYSTKMIQIIRRNLSPSHKLNSFLNLRENANLLPEKIKTTLSGDKIYGSFTKFPTYEECLSLMPRNSVYVVIQTNLNLTEVYCGILTNEKVEEEYQTNAKVFKKRLEKSELTAYWLLREKLNKIKKQIVYLACSDSKKLDKLLEDKQAQVDEIHQKFTKMSSWWLQVLVEILNRVKQAEVPVEVDKNKKGAKDTKKKAGKDQVAGYQSPLGASPAGFESITFLVDDFFEGFAFNLLPGLEVVPAISFDSSMFYLSRKMQSMNFRADANNSNGFGADKGKYVSFEFRDNAIGFKSISGELTKQFASLKMEGVSSSDRTPSIGDLKKYLHEPGYLQIYGSLDFLNHIRVPTLLESCGMAKVKLLMIADHLNYEKSLINKFIPLDNESQVNSIDEEMKLLKAVANLLDVSLIKNVWCMNKAQNQLLISEIYRNLGSGHYLGACLNSKQEKTPNQLLQKYMFRIYGCPVLRM